MPGLNVRRTETTVELPSGGAMMISGLLQTVTKSTIDALPGLMQLPVLGTLFRSRDFINNETARHDMAVLLSQKYNSTPIGVTADGYKLCEADAEAIAKDILRGGRCATIEGQGDSCKVNYPPGYIPPKTN